MFAPPLKFPHNPKEEMDEEARKGKSEVPL